MTNQPLIDFIKQQLQLGLTKEKITNELFANGWNTQDIEEGFAATGIPVATSAPSTLPPNIPQMINPNTNQTANTNINAEVKPVMSANLNPNLSSVISEPVSIKTESNLNKWIFISLSTLLVLAIAASVYFLRDEIVKLPIVKDFFPQEEVVVPVDDTDIISTTDTTQLDVTDQKPNENLNTITPLDDEDLNALEGDINEADTTIDVDTTKIN